ncbi:hypothetical protein L0668_03145 [Paraglaciecola aquimarina]|uniref:SHOCT domain-containing protein n=1 Tax=Paraglaciecola algarum TaxID=3050085 RepID=A0ABS9D3R8_9ALTE|nr:hypothetical protein [Paraglaciecola sp. G1-23]MCF2947087.1 hypothetical protein [Paraglaciecola sp. G1-23]
MNLIYDVSQYEGVNQVDGWLDPQINLNNENSFFFAHQSGRIYYSGKSEGYHNSEILNLPQALKDDGFMSLTSFVLHPSFTRPEDPDYATLFTTHTSKYFQANIQNRLTIDGTNIPFTYETIITAWRYNFQYQTIDPESAREVLRIPIVSKEQAIQTMKFKSDNKPWSRDFGLLYFSLNSLNDYAHIPIYSGAILRINPKKFGARNYLIPPNNPFIKDPSVDDEIVFMGAKHIENFYWAKSDNASIFINHKNAKNYSVSEVMYGDDWRSKPQINPQWDLDELMPATLYYTGRKFLELKDKLLFVTLVDNSWHVNARSVLDINQDFSVFEVVNIEQEPLKTANLSLIQGKLDDIFIFDRSKSTLHRLTSYSQVIDINETKDEKADHGNVIKYFVIVFVFLPLVFFTYIYFGKTAKERAFRQYVKRVIRFKYNSNTQIVLLFKGNKKECYKQIPISDINRCEVLLNGTIIGLVDNQLKKLFSNQKEDEIREIFSTEHFSNMVDDKMRKIELVVHLNAQTHTLCVYLRKGKNRVTSTKYFESVEIVLDLFWDLSKHFNPKETEARDFQAPIEVAQGYRHVPIKSEPSESKNGEYVDSTLSETNDLTEQPDLVQAIDKLVNLHKQGYLSDKEFSQAKAKLFK